VGTPTTPTVSLWHLTDCLRSHAGAWERKKFAAAHASDVAENMVEAALKDPKIAGRGAGIITAKLGSAALNGRISVLSSIWTILSTVISKAPSTIPGALKISAEEVKALTLEEKIGLAKKIVEMMRTWAWS